MSTLYSALIIPILIDSPLLHSYPIQLLQIIVAETLFPIIKHITASDLQITRGFHWLLDDFLKSQSIITIGNTLYPMAKKRAFVERNSRGKERIVLTRSSSLGRPSTRELLHEAEAREQDLIAQNQDLRARLSFAQKAEWTLQNVRLEHQRLAEEHYHCRHLRAQLEAQVREVRRIEDKLEDEEYRSEKLEEKIRLLKRGRGGHDYRQRYEQKVQEVELLRRRLSESERLSETRLADKNRIILYLKNILRAHGIWF